MAKRGERLAGGDFGVDGGHIPNMCTDAARHAKTVFFFVLPWVGAQLRKRSSVGWTSSRRWELVDESREIERVERWFHLLSKLSHEGEREKGERDGSIGVVVTVATFYKPEKKTRNSIKGQRRELVNKSDFCRLFAPLLVFL